MIMFDQEQNPCLRKPLKRADITPNASTLAVFCCVTSCAQGSNEIIRKLLIFKTLNFNQLQNAYCALLYFVAFWGIGSDKKSTCLTQQKTARVDAFGVMSARLSGFLRHGFCS